MLNLLLAKQQYLKKMKPAQLVAMSDKNGLYASQI